MDRPRFERCGTPHEKGSTKVLASPPGSAPAAEGCSACRRWYADKIPAGKYSVSTSNRSFEEGARGELLHTPQDCGSRRQAVLRLRDRGSARCLKM